MEGPIALQTDRGCHGDHYYYRDRDHQDGIFNTMHQMRNNRDLCDVTLVVGNSRIPAHRLVLAASSQYFRAMFTYEMMERDARVVELHDVDPSALELLVDYCYTSEIIISDANVQLLLPASSLLQMTSVRDACCKFLSCQLHPTNCLGIRHFADVHACEDLKSLSHQYTLHNFTEVCETEEFLLLSVKDVLDLISSSELNVLTEEQVFVSVMQWVKFDADNRKEHIPQLLGSIRLPLLTRDFLVNHVEGDPLIRENPACKDLLIEALTFQLMPEYRQTLQSDFTMERRCVNTKPMMFAIGGGSSVTFRKECERYNPATDDWTLIAAMTSARYQAGSIGIGGKVYAVGGHDGTLCLASAECYSPQTNKWTKITPMGTKRSGLGVCQWNGLLYAAGGYDGASCLNSVERYDPLTLTWTSVAAMTYRRRFLKLAVLENYIYAIGGQDGAATLNTVEKLDPKTNRWTTLPNMLTNRSQSGVGVLDNMLYVCGGQNEQSRGVNTVERFNPSRSAWEFVASMHTRRSGLDVAVIDTHLYAVGGCDGNVNLTSVERYNPLINKWTPVTSMNNKRGHIGVAVALVSSFKKPAFLQGNLAK